MIVWYLHQFYLPLFFTSIPFLLFNSNIKCWNLAHSWKYTNLKIINPNTLLFAPNMLLVLIYLIIFILVIPQFLSFCLLLVYHHVSLTFSYLPRVHHITHLLSYPFKGIDNILISLFSPLSYSQKQWSYAVPTLALMSADNCRRKWHKYKNSCF